MEGEDVDGSASRGQTSVRSDGIHTLDKQTAALHSYDNQVAGPQNFYGTPRSIRLGFELSF